MSYVFVIATRKQPLNPVHPGRAGLLPSSGNAAIFITIILKGARVPQHLSTGLALVNEGIGDILFASELIHRGQAIQKAMEQHKTRNRKPGFAHRRRRAGWLALFLECRVTNVLTTATQVRAVVSLGSMRGTRVGQELVRASSSLDIQTKRRLVQGIGHRFCTRVQRYDGPGYDLGDVSDGERTSPLTPQQERAISPSFLQAREKWRALGEEIGRTIRS